MRQSIIALAGATLALSVSTVNAQDAEQRFRNETGYSGPYVIVKPDGVETPPFDFNEPDDALLEEITAATFRYFWDSPNVTDTGFVNDRGGGAISCAGVGFQFGAIVLGVERGYITRSEGERRVRRLLGGFLESDQIRKEGMFFHFITGQPLRRSGGSEVSTVDTPLMFQGALIAGGYFGGEIEQMVTEMLASTNWNFFTQPTSRPDWEEGLVSLSWQPNSAAAPLGSGSLSTATWQYPSGEELTIYFQAAANPNPDNALSPDLYYRVKRPLGEWGGLGEMVRKPSAGGTFLQTFAQVFIDYGGIAEAMGADRPDLYGYNFRAPTDWWENSRRHALMHRGKAISEAPAGFTTLGPNAWGLSASDGPSGYQVPGLVPPAVPIPGAQVNFDVPGGYGGDNWLDGTVAIYGAGQMIMFTPDESVAALRHYRNLTDGSGQPLVWADDYGFYDSFNLHIGGAPFVDTSRLSIDQGPMLLAIENARSKLIWDNFHKHPIAKLGMQRLGLTRAGDAGPYRRGGGCGDATLHDLGSGGATGSFGLDINENGAVTGVVRTLGDASAFRWTSGTGLELLPRLAGDGPARGIAINDAGFVAGSAIASASADGPIAVVWDDEGAVIVADSPGGSDGAVAVGVDDFGRLAGLSFGPNGIRREQGFRYEAGFFGSFGTNPGEATGIAPNGFTAANAHTEGGLRGQIYDFDRSQREPLPGDSWSEVHAVNTSGVAVGVSANQLDRRAAMWLADGTPVAIPSLPNATSSIALGVNESGDVVGFCDTPGGQRAFLWTASSGTVDLNDQLGAADAAEWKITQARAINDARQIAGSGVKSLPDGTEAFRAFRLDVGSLVAASCPADLNGDCVGDAGDIEAYFDLVVQADGLRGPADNRVPNPGFESPNPSDPSRPEHWSKLNNPNGSYETANTNGAPHAHGGSRFVSVSGAPGGGFNSWNSAPNVAASNAPINTASDLTLELYYGITSATPVFSTGLFAAKIEYFADDGSGGIGANVGSSGDLEITEDLSPTPDWTVFRRVIPASAIPADAAFARVLLFTFDGSGTPVGEAYFDDVAIYQEDPGYDAPDYNRDGVIDAFDVIDLIADLSVCG
ncbi:MAG: hypothetical protein CMJ31_02720 [Phycisphaerae bacterium]|nr:hypothetical protein [Phycisphaerae bacterium]